VDPVPDPLLLRKSGSAGIEPRPLDLWPGTLTTRPQRRYHRGGLLKEIGGLLSST
jgi:hypothetical protein